MMLPRTANSLSDVIARGRCAARGLTKAFQVLAVLHVLTSAVPAEEPDQDALNFFETKIRPVLTEQCYTCHSAEAAEAGKLRGGLLLDSREGSRQGGDSGPAVVPGDLEESLLISALKHESYEMPPKGKLADEVIADFVRWIEMGAPDPREGKATSTAAAIDLEAGRRFWSFQPLAAVEPPPDDSGWSRTELDRFIIARQRLVDLRPNPPAEPRVLVRRAWFDLLGLPPSPQEIETWTARLTQKDSAGGIDYAAWVALVDHLLASPHYGERWARHWMDVARFAESHGYEQDYDRPNAYHYRDFLIHAFNFDLPYDQFVAWQLAGDELAPEEPMAWMATGFLGAGPFPTQLTEAEFESARYDELDDMTATTGVAFLGLSIGCARCHDHKFDPIPSSDYYGLAATFTTTIRSEKELVPDHIADGATVKVMVTSEGLPHLPHHADDRGYPHFYPETHQLRRGDVHQKGEVAQPGFLKVLLREGISESRWRREPPAGSRTSFRRAALAEWITDAEYGAGHLAARVMVNRLWQHHFGRGLVATPNDFGASGEPPTHPELLDWLAADLIAGDWRLKRVHKRMMTSSAYLQSTAFDKDREKIDPENSLLWRREPRRLEAEAIRDAMFAVSGRLDPSMYGPGTLDPDTRRRSVYFFIKRSELIPSMMLFDWPEHLVSIGRRASTTTAPQALMFMNSPAARGCAEALACNVESPDATQSVARAYLYAFGRRPTELEKRLAVEFVKEQATVHRTAGRADADGLALTDLCQTLMSMNEFVYVD